MLAYELVESGYKSCGYKRSMGTKRLVTDDANHFFLSLKISRASAVQIDETGTNQRSHNRTKQMLVLMRGKNWINMEKTSQSTVEN